MLNGKTRTTFNPSGVKGWEKNTLKGYYPGKFSHQITSFIWYYELLYPNMNGNRKASQSIDDHIVWNILRKVVNDQQITFMKTSRFYSDQTKKQQTLSNWHCTTFFEDFPTVSSSILMGIGEEEANKNARLSIKFKFDGFNEFALPLFLLLCRGDSSL